jgi:hypothetical protein
MRDPISDSSPLATMEDLKPAPRPAVPRSTTSRFRQVVSLLLLVGLLTSSFSEFSATNLVLETWENLQLRPLSRDPDQRAVQLLRKQPIIGESPISSCFSNRSDPSGLNFYRRTYRPPDPRTTHLRESSRRFRPRPAHQGRSRHSPSPKRSSRRIVSFALPFYPRLKRNRQRLILLGGGSASGASSYLVQRM